MPKPLARVVYILFCVLSSMGMVNTSMATHKSGDEQRDVICLAKPLYHCRSGNGETTLLFIHGWGGSESFWKNQLAHFSSDYSVVTIELPGHGQSELGKNQVTISKLATALGSFIEQLNLENIVLIAHDMGGYIGLSLAASAQGRERIVSLVAIESLVDVKVDLPGKQYRRILDSLHKRFSATARQMTKDLFSPSADESLVEWVSNTVATNNQDIAMSLLKDFIDIDLSQELKSFTGSIYILNTQLNPPQIDKLKEYNKNVFSVPVPWEEHFVFIERPALFNATLENILVSISGSGD